MKKRLIVISSLLLLRLLFAAEPVWAVQAHGGSEGLVSHQIGHALFLFGLVYLLFRLHSQHPEGAGWREFTVFLWLLAGWNVMTFTGHLLNEFVAGEKFVKVDGVIVSFTIENAQDAFYFLTRLDHILLVPACGFLLVALRKWRLAA